MNQIVRDTSSAVAATTAAKATHPLIIIGCGFGGMALAIELQQRGINEFLMLERASDVGGVWRDNTYPGAACDVVSRLYSFASDQWHEWSQPFAPRDEIWNYTLKVVERHGIRRHVRFNTEVREATFDDKTGLWTLITGAGERYTTPILVSAVGLFNNPFIPEIPGRESFKGPMFHTAKWNHDVSLDGRTVAVIGSGASAVQVVPTLAPGVSKLISYQRSPQYVVPKAFMPGAGKWDAWLNARKWLRPLARLKIHLGFEKFILRRRMFPNARVKGEAGFLKFLESKVKDPVLRKKLTPSYPLGCKRQLVSNSWYEALTCPNVEVVVDPIERITPEGIITRDGVERKVDAIVYATGFTPTKFLTPMRVQGLAGRDLATAWREGAEAFLGMTISGFPNFFMMYGPNTNATTSILLILEGQARYIVSAIRALRGTGARFMNVRAETQRSFNAELQKMLQTTVWARTDCSTYTKQENGRITTNWPGYTSDYLWRIRGVRKRDFEFAAKA